ncbi:MAG: polysaccharide deacetylase family protein [candidate division Zixibacteria bacterium]|nr:polysaccharide deacetylase family protein [candidate division Zixibacteria bacterium]
MRSLIKYIFCLAVYYSGILFLHRLLFDRNTALVLTYHRVLPTLKSEAAPSQTGMIVTNSTFEKQMDFLNKTHEVITLAEMIGRLKESKIDQRYCAITFDDGWRDVYTHAFPVLEKRNLPAIMFLSAGFVGTDRLFWPERLTRILLSTGELDQNKVSALADIDRKSAEEIHAIIATNDNRKKLKQADRLIERFKKLDPEIREELIGLLENSLSQTLTDEARDRHILNWHEIEEMRRRGISFGSHTVNHAILTRIPPDEAKMEITQSKQMLEKKLGEEIDLFAYPNGDWNDDVKEMVKEAKYKASVTTMNGKNDYSTDPYLLGRLTVHQGMSCSPRGNFSRAVFACEISGLLDSVRRILAREQREGN